MSATRTRIYLSSFAIAYVVIGFLATVQILFVYQEFSPQFVLIPILAASVFGFLLGSIRWLRHRLQHQKELFQAVADFGQEFTYIRNPNGKFIYVSPAAQELTGYEAKAFYEDPALINRLVHPDDQDVWEHHDHPLNQDGRPEPLDIRFLQKDGTVRTLRHLCGPLYSSDGTYLGTRSTNVDVTHTLRSEHHIKQLAEFDPLTSLGNRRRLERRLRECMQEGDELDKSTGILYIDLDRFKYINDVYGHSIGDIILSEFSRRMSQSLDETDSEPFRFGGDEFVILVPGVNNADELMNTAREIQKLIQNPVAVSEMQFNLGASIGIAMYPQDGKDPETLIKHADLAMYEAKGSHNKLCFFEANLANVAADLLQYETMLRDSLERKELVAWFQPIIELSTGETIGAEALARWIHSEHGMIGPQHFISMAEDTGLIVPLGDQILTQGLMHLKQWKDAGRPMQMNFNVSPRQLQLPGFIPALLHKITEAGLEPGDVVMEITESVLMENLEGVREMLIEARDAGIYVALDDFGTGFSSFKYLADLPADILKLDHTLLRGLEQNERRLRLIRSIVYMAQDLGLVVVAEGIETESLEELFRGMGPVLGQGYYYGKPVPPEEFVPMLDLDHTVSGQEVS